MLPYRLDSFLFVRAPAFSCDAFSISNLQQFCNDEFFRKALYVASPGFYDQVSIKNFNVESMDAGMRHSLLKYFNRMCYRPTPFGMFSSFSCTEWVSSQNGLRFNEIEDLYLKADLGLTKAIASYQELKASKFYGNPTIYSVGNELRYILPDTIDSSGAFGIASVNKNKFLKDLIDLCADGVSRSEILNFISAFFPNNDPDNVLNELIVEELIFTDTKLNITGENYLNRIARLAEDGNISSLESKLHSISAPKLFIIGNLSKVLEEFVDKSVRIRSPLYVNFGKGLSGGVSEKYKQVLMDGLFCLSHLQRSVESTPIELFKTRFMERFEEREISLLRALDPEYGIGYERLENDTEEEGLLSGITFSGKESSGTIRWGKLQQFFMNKICTTRPGEKVVITARDIEHLKKTGNRRFSPSISILFRICNQKVFIEEAGGASAGTMTARFTPFDKNILQHARDIAKAEQDANPGVIFAEIAYFGEEHASNINTREHIRHYEIPVLVHSTLAAEQVINLNDLYVSIQANEVVLRSKRLNCRVVPRHSTAYNYLRSELPVFRFLCDLQYQGIAASFHLRPEEILPGLSFYPRIEYKNCILSEACWILNRENIQEITNTDKFLVWASQVKLSPYFAISSADKQLVFSLHDLLSIEMFLVEIKRMDEVVLKEFFVPKDMSPLLSDQESGVYIHQLIATLIQDKPAYVPLPSQTGCSANVVRSFSPGEEWIYFKIYCASRNAGYILSRRLYSMLKRHLKRDEIKKWFFIRYYDPDHHLRVRILANKEMIRELPLLFNNRLKALIKSQLITKIQIDTYMREMERYGSENIEFVESIFRYSSELVIEHLMENRDENGVMTFAMLSVDFIFNGWNLETQGRLELLEQICVSLMNELGSEKQLRGDLNKKYRINQQNINEFMSMATGFFTRTEREKLSVLGDELRLLARHNFNLKTRSRKLLADILHMHMNRIFSSEQRKKELVIYYFSLRYLRSVYARSVINSGD